MRYELNKNVAALTAALNVADPVKRDAVYFGIAYCLANILINGENRDLSLGRTKLVALLDVINEMSIINYARLKDLVITAMTVRLDIIEGNLDKLPKLNIIGDLFYFPQYLSTDAIENINSNMDSVNNAILVCKVWYKQTYLKGL